MNISKKPLISLVIPTKERCQTLYYTLETALQQNCDRYEIVVSDNFSQDNTRDVAHGFADLRIKYFNTGRRLSMRDNWEFAFEHVSGDYVIFIGDDDAVMPQAIDALLSTIELDPCDVYCWPSHVYVWPIGQNKSVVKYRATETPPFDMELKSVARFAASWGLCNYAGLPHLYHSAVSRKILDRIKSSTGRVFHTTCPDVFMAYALPAFSEKAINVGKCVTVVGHSAKSNSGALMAKDGNAILGDFAQEYKGYQIHHSLCPEVPFLINLIPDTVLVAMDMFPDVYRDVPRNYSAIWAYMHRIGKYETLMGIVARRNRIRQCHDFSAMRFLFYALVHHYLDLKSRLLHKKLEKYEDRCPENIRDFVKVVKEWK